MTKKENIIIASDVSAAEPTCLDRIRGQKQVIDVLNSTIAAYFNDRMAGRKPVFGPVALVGPSGTGKTLIAKALHAELGNTDYKPVNGQNLGSTQNIYSYFLDANDNSTLFIDEAHGIKPKIQDQLLTILSERKIDIPSTRGVNVTRRMPVANYPIIVATTHEYSLSPALRSRMKIYCRFNHYALEDLIEITRQRANGLHWQFQSDDVLKEICLRAKKIPRLALRHLQACWNVCRSLDLDMITIEHVKKAFELTEIDALGLDHLEKQYLTIVSADGPIALNVISSRLGSVPSQTLKSVIEPYLLQEGLISKDGVLRIITEKGREHLDKSKEKEE